MADPSGDAADRGDVRRVHRVEAELRHALEIVRRQGDRLQDAQRELIALRQRTLQADLDDRRLTREIDRITTVVTARDAAFSRDLARRAARRHAHRLGRLSRRIDQLSTAIEAVEQSGASGSVRRRATIALLRHPRAIARLAAAFDSGLFDAGYYSRRYPSAVAHAIPIVAYALNGEREHQRPNPLFDPAWYAAHYGDVAASGLSPLVHYVVSSERELRHPHPLFDAERYTRQTLCGPGAGPTPLAHYLWFGADASLSPHALFDAAFYLRKYPDVAAAGANPLAHFLEYGRRDRRQGHPLVDPAFYFAHHPRAEATGEDALVCFVQRGAAHGHAPHPLFDTAFYLETNPEVRTSGRNALEHFLDVGWRDGRRPNPLFDPRYYLARYSDVRASGVNPLIHFVEYGARQLRDPSPEFSTSDYFARYPDVAQGGGDALTHYLWHGRQEGRGIQPAPAVPPPADAGLINVVTLPDSGLPVRLTVADRNPARPSTRTVIVATHVVPVPPRAGNSFRVLRLLQWLRRHGYRTLLVLAPLHDTIGDVTLGRIAEDVGDVILVTRDGAIEHVLDEGQELIAALDGRTVVRRPGLEASPWQHVDDGFCHDALVEVVLHLQAALHPCALLVQYIWMNRLLTLTDQRTLKIVDTIDAYSSKSAKVGDFGIGDHFLDEREEAARLEKADLVLAIQDDERAQFAQLLPHRRVITVGVDFDPVRETRPITTSRRIGYVGSDNPMNTQGVKDFLRFAWPGILARFPDAELVLAGNVARALAGSWPNVRRDGPLADLDTFYEQSRLIINPANAGTGLKIKGLEALCHFRPLVTWPAGVDGFGPLSRFARVAHDWFEFTEQVCELLAPAELTSAFTEDDRRLIQQRTSADLVYARLAAELDAFFLLHEAQAAAPAHTGRDSAV